MIDEKIHHRQDRLANLAQAKAVLEARAEDRYRIEQAAFEEMAYQLQIEIGKAIYRLRKCTVEPVIGIIKDILGFRQFSLRSITAAGE